MLSSASATAPRGRRIAVAVLAADVVGLVALAVLAVTRQDPAPPAPARVVSSQCIDGTVVQAVDDGGSGLLARDTEVSC